MAHASNRRYLHQPPDSGAECTQTERDESETSLKKCNQPRAMEYSVNHQEPFYTELKQRRRDSYSGDADSSSFEYLEPCKRTNQNQKPRRHGQKLSGSVVYYKPIINHYNSSQSGISQGSEEYDHQPPPAPCENRVYSTPYHGNGTNNSRDGGYITNATLRQAVTGSGEYAMQSRGFQNMDIQNLQMSDNETKGLRYKKEPVYGQVVVTPSNMNNLQPAIPNWDQKEQIDVQIVVTTLGKQQTFQGKLQNSSVNGVGKLVSGLNFPENSPDNRIYCNIHQSAPSTVPQQINVATKSPWHQDIQRGSQEAKDRSRLQSYPPGIQRIAPHQVTDADIIPHIPRQIDGDIIPDIPRQIKRNHLPGREKYTRRQVSNSAPDIRTANYQETSFWQRIGLGKKSLNGSHICHIDELVSPVFGEEKVIHSKNLLRQYGLEGEWFVSEAEHQPTHPYVLHVKLRSGNVVSFPVQKVRSSNKEKFTIEDSKNYKCICKLLEHYSSNNLPSTELTIKQAFDLLGKRVTHV